MEENSGAMVAGALGAFAATLGIFAVVLGVAWYILQVVAYWKIFTKAGKPGWHSIIPILNTWDELDLSWNRTVAWIAIALIVLTSILSGSANAEDASSFLKTVFYIMGILSFVITLVGQYKLAKAFGRGFGFFIGLLLLNPIFKLILGFGGDRYQGRQG